MKKSVAMTAVVIRHGQPLLRAIQKWELTLGAVHNNNRNGYRLDTTIPNFLFGSRVNLFGRYSRFQPCFEALWGGVYATSSAQILDNAAAAILVASTFPLTTPGQPTGSALPRKQFPSE